MNFWNPESFRDDGIIVADEIQLPVGGPGWKGLDMFQIAAVHIGGFQKCVHLPSAAEGVEISSQYFWFSATFKEAVEFIQLLVAGTHAER